MCARAREKREKEEKFCPSSSAARAHALEDPKNKTFIAAIPFIYVDCSHASMTTILLLYDKKKRKRKSVSLGRVVTSVENKNKKNKF